MTGRRGAFIVLEGCDRAGKTTQCKRIAKYLTENGHETTLIRYPDRFTTTGNLLNVYLEGVQDIDDRSIHLLFSANRWERHEHIIHALKKGINVIADRYVYSGVAFTAAKGVDLDWCKKPDNGLPKPDVVLFLDLDIEDASKREGFGAERYETIEMQIKVRSMFHQLKDDSWKIIDSSQPIDDVTKAIEDAIQPTILAELPPLQTISW